MNSHGLLTRFLSCSHAHERAGCGAALLEYASAELGQIDFDHCYPPENLQKRLETEAPDRCHAVGWIALCALVQALRRGMLEENSTSSCAPADAAPLKSAMVRGFSWREFREVYALAPESTIGSVDAYLRLIVRDLGNPPPAPQRSQWADYLIHAIVGSQYQAGARRAVDFRIVGAPSGLAGLGAILTIRLYAWGCLDLAEPLEPENSVRDLLLAPSLTTPVMARWDTSFAAAMRRAMQAAALSCLRASPPEAAPGTFWFQPPGSAGGSPRGLPNAAWSVSEVSLYQRKSGAFEMLAAGRLESPEIQRILLNHQEQSSGNPPDPFGRLGLSGPSAAAACYTAFLDFFRGTQSDDGLMVLGRLAVQDGTCNFMRVDALQDKFRIIAAAKESGQLPKVERLYVAGLRPHEDGAIFRQSRSPVELVDLARYLGTSGRNDLPLRPISRRVERASEACELMCRQITEQFPSPVLGSTFSTLLEPRVIVAARSRLAEHCDSAMDLAVKDDREPVAGARDCTGTGVRWAEVAPIEDSRLWHNWLRIPSTPAQLLLGRAGSGKTTVMLMSAANAATEAALALRNGRREGRPVVLPAFIAARDLPGDRMFHCLDDILAMSWNQEIRASLRALFSGENGWACEFLFLIDGLDEVEPGTASVDSLVSLVTGPALRNECAGVSVVLSCRLADVSRWESRLPKQFRGANATATLAPFGNREQHAFLIKRLTSAQAGDIERRLKLDPALRDLCSVPLMLDFIASLAERGRISSLAGENRTTPILCLVIDNILAGGWRRNFAGGRSEHLQRLATIPHFRQTAIEWLADIAFFLLSHEHLLGRANQFDTDLWDKAFEHVAACREVRAMEIPKTTSDGKATAGNSSGQMRAQDFLRYCMWTGMLHWTSPKLADGERQFSFQHRSLLEYLAAKGLRKGEASLRSLIERGRIRIPNQRDGMPGTEEISPWHDHPEFELMLHFLFEMVDPAQGRALYRHLSLQEEDLFGTMTVWRAHAASLVRNIDLPHSDTEQLQSDLLGLLCQPGFELLEWPGPLLPLRCLGGQVAESLVFDLLTLLDGGENTHHIPFCDVINGLGRCAGLLDRRLADVVVNRLGSAFPGTGGLLDDRRMPERKVDALWRWAGHAAREQADFISDTLLVVLMSPRHDTWVRRRAAFGLGRLGNILTHERNTEIAFDLLRYFDSLTGNDRNSVGNRLFDALGQLVGKLEPDASAHLVSELARSMGSTDNQGLNWVRRGAADALLCWASHPVGTSVCEVVECLLDRMCVENEECAVVREGAAWALDAWMAHLDPECATQLAEGFAKCILPDSEESPARVKRAVAALGRLPGRVGAADPRRWIEALLDRFNAPIEIESIPQPNENLIREKIADALGRWAGHCGLDHSNQVVSSLLSRLESGIPSGLNVRQRSAEALGRWAGHLENGLSRQVIGALLARLNVQIESNREIRERAAEALGWWISHQPIDVTSGILDTLLRGASQEGEPTSQVRYRVVLSLGEFSKAEDPVLRHKALSGLMDRLTDGQETSSSVQQALSMALRGWANEAGKPGATGLTRLQSHFSKLQNPEVLGNFAITLALWASHAPENEAREIAEMLHQRLVERSLKYSGTHHLPTADRYDGRDLARRRLAEALRVISARCGIFIPRLVQEAMDHQI